MDGDGLGVPHPGSGWLGLVWHGILRLIPVGVHPDGKQFDVWGTASAVVPYMDWLAASAPKVFFVIESMIQMHVLAPYLTWLGGRMASSIQLDGCSHPGSADCMEKVRRREDVMGMSSWPLYYRWAMYDHVFAAAAVAAFIGMYQFGVYTRAEFRIRSALLVLAYCVTVRAQATAYAMAVADTAYGVRWRTVMPVQHRRHVAVTVANAVFDAIAVGGGVSVSGFVRETVRDFHARLVRPALDRMLRQQQRQEDILLRLGDRIRALEGHAGDLASRVYALEGQLALAAPALPPVAHQDHQ